VVNGSPGRVIFCSGLRPFISVRGGEYFFVPSIAALGAIAAGALADQ
jgi:hypothetical protein